MLNKKENFQFCDFVCSYFLFVDTAKLGVLLSVYLQSLWIFRGTMHWKRWLYWAQVDSYKYKLLLRIMILPATRQSNCFLCACFYPWKMMVQIHYLKSHSELGDEVIITRCWRGDMYGLNVFSHTSEHEPPPVRNPEGASSFIHYFLRYISINVEFSC